MSEFEFVTGFVTAIIIHFRDIHHAVINLINPGVSLSHFNILLKLCPDDRRASYIAFYATLLNAGAFVGPMIGVALSQWLGIRPVLVLGGIIRLVGALLFYLFPIKIQEGDIG